MKKEKLPKWKLTENEEFKNNEENRNITLDGKTLYDLYRHSTKLIK